MHVLAPTVFALLNQNLQRAAEGQTIDLSTSLAQLAQQERYLAYELSGSRYDISYRYGLLLAQLAISLGGQDRDLILTELVNLLAQQ
jgi:UTP--glucose-1-phosphate uridylyltransferase